MKAFDLTAKTCQSRWIDIIYFVNTPTQSSASGFSKLQGKAYLKGEAPVGHLATAAPLGNVRVVVANCFILEHLQLSVQSLQLRLQFRFRLFCFDRKIEFSPECRPGSCRPGWPRRNRRRRRRPGPDWRELVAPPQAKGTAGRLAFAWRPSGNTTTKIAQNF